MSRPLSSDHEQLIQAITEQVLAALQNGVEPPVDPPAEPSAAGHTADTEPRNTANDHGNASSGATPSATPHDSPSRAAIRPPIGVCTGDYSQFPELRGQTGSTATAATPHRNDQTRDAQDNRSGSAQPAGPADRAAEHTAPSRSTAASASPSAAGTASGTTPPEAGDDSGHAEVLTGIVTATRLEETAKRIPDRVIRLSTDAQLSPLAADRVKERGLHVQRANAPAGTTTRGPSRSADTWLWWIEGECPAVQAVTDTMAPALRPLARRREASALTEAVAAMAHQVQRRQAAGGVLFVPSAARAGCFANRCEPLRAVVGTCEQAVAEGVEQLGANVLIVEYAHHGREAMRRMVERFVCTPRQGTGAVDRELRELKRCV